MASLLLSEAAKLSNDEVVEGIVEDIISEDMWFQYLPFVQINGLSHVFKREATLGAVDFAGIGQDLTGDAYRAGASFETVNVGIQAIVSEILIDSQIDDQLSDIDSQLQVQISSKAKAMSRFFMNACINYGSNGHSFTQSNNGKIGAVNYDAAPMFKGMKALLDEESGNAQDVNHPNYQNGNPTQTLELIEDDASSARFGRAGRVFTLEDLDKLLDIVTKGAEFMLMNKSQRRVLRTLLRNTGGGTDAAQIMRSDLGSGKPLLHYQETPVFISDFVSSVEPVAKLHAAASLTISATTDTSVTVSEDVKTEIEAIVGVVSPTNPAYLVARTGSTGKWSKAVLKITAITDNGATTTFTVNPAFAITDDEKNKPQALAALSTYNTTAGLVGKAASVFERVDGTSIYAGKFGEGEGICGFTLDMSQAIQIKYVGPSREYDQEQYRLKFYCGLETYSRLAIARLKSVLPL